MRAAFTVCFLYIICFIGNVYAVGTFSNLGPGINTSLDEGFPFITPDGQTMYYTRYLSPDTGDDLYIAHYVGGAWVSAGPITELNTNFNDNTPRVVGTHLYFSTNRWGPTYWDYRLAIATYNGTSWGNVIELPMESIDGADCFPSLTADEHTIYFASTRTPNYGEYDIFCATNQGGTWGNIQNLGPVINSAGSEETPYITPDGNTLFFVKNAQFLYVSNKMGESWTEPRLLPPPVNDGLNSKVGVFYDVPSNTLYLGLVMPGEGQCDLWQCVYSFVGIEPSSLGKLKSSYH